MIKVHPEIYVNPSNVTYAELKIGGARLGLLGGDSVWIPFNGTQAENAQVLEDLVHRLSFGVDA